MMARTASELALLLLLLIAILVPSFERSLHGKYKRYNSEEDDDQEVSLRQSEEECKLLFHSSEAESLWVTNFSWKTCSLSCILLLAELPRESRRSVRWWCVRNLATSKERRSSMQMLHACLREWHSRKTNSLCKLKLSCFKLYYICFVHCIVPALR